MLVSTLYDAFENLLSGYQPVEDLSIEAGMGILDLIQQDWQVFSEHLIENDRAGQLFEVIMGSGWDDDSGDPILGAYDHYIARHHHWAHDTLDDIWQQFVEHVKSDSARLLKFHDDYFNEFLYEEITGSRTISYPAGKIFYRARIGFIQSDEGAKPYQGLAMGAPPAEKANSGRANQKGKVVLYCATQESTAVAEVRPARGEYVSVAEVRANRELKLLDLVTEPEWPNPFTDDAVNYRVELVELLAGFAEELGKPLRSRDDPTDYIPSQKLVELIKTTKNLDGIIYPSAMAERGSNIVLFDPSVGHICPSHLVEIFATKVEYRDAQMYRE